MNTLEELKGLGSRTIKILNKLGINTIEDLIGYYPFRYDIIERSNIDNLEQNDKIIIDGMVETLPSVFYIHKRLDKMTFRVQTHTTIITVIIFNRGFLKGKLGIGTEVTLIGKFDKKHNTVIASELRFGKIAEKTIEPIYRMTYGLTGKQLSTYIVEALKHDFVVQSYLPRFIEEKYQFLDKKDCIYHVHIPEDVELLKKAIKRLKYEELFIFMLQMNYLQYNRKNQNGLARDIDFKMIEDFIGGLPFMLTTDQMKGVKNIYEDLICSHRMNRLLQGDVGSGKTIVAMIAMYMNYLGGYQSALMAPTEILAVQHYENAKKLFENYSIHIALLTGKFTMKEKRELYRKLKSGEIDILIGTHALISEQVEYANLGLVITDEQHRFGVNQRSHLKNKGMMPDILYMSATPIPRTYALTLYGDMDISSIRTMPHGRKPVLTYLKHNQEIKDVLSMMLEELKLHHQIYVIAPLIEESDKIDLTNVQELEMNMNKAFGKYYKIGVLHGKMGNEEKEAVMEGFQKNEIQILISTTVIEVGVDVQNATMMVIFDSFRFGLSTLHQLRGRVGRNDLQSYCILISNRDTERLKILTRTNDGFEISEEDFLLRGSGDLFGYRQSGDMNFALADIKRDYKLLVMAKEDSMDFLSSGGYYEHQYFSIRKLIEKSTNLD